MRSIYAPLTPEAEQTFKNHLSHFCLLFIVNRLNHPKDYDGDTNSCFTSDDNANKHKHQPYRGRGRGASRERQVGLSNGKGKPSGE